MGRGPDLTRRAGTDRVASAWPELWLEGGGPSGRESVTTAWYNSEAQQRAVAIRPGGTLAAPRGDRPPLRVDHPRDPMMQG